MEKPLVAVVGRPNVGKSTFFNRIAGKKISIVKDMPGVTRDRIYADAEWCGHAFTIVDTGGLDVKNKDDFQQNITKQAALAVEVAQVVLLFVDGKQGLLPADYDAANFLRKYNVPIVLVVNKIDNNELEKTYEFYNLGLGEPIAISAELNKGIGDLLDVIVSKFEHKVDASTLDERIKIAVVGKPNAGKSSLVNRLLGENRVMVSNVAGTTRDAIDTPFKYNGKEYLLIDTAGIRRKRSIDKDSVELYSVIRSFDAIRRADIVVLVVDSVEGLSEQDVRIAGFIHEEGKPSIILMNKWDTVEKDTYTMNKFNDKLSEDLKFMDYYVPLYGSALTGLRINKLMESVDTVLANASRRITTGTLNEILQNAVLTNEPPTKNGRRLKIYYITQPSTNPPTFVLFVNDKELMHFSYLRYLENCIRNAVDFKGTPIRLLVNSKKEKDV
ncbi:MAG: ribosome biogenesis GTPase Der [Eubacteriales bacterium]|nr:ribosome biogenesis GTPase Der [Eubacteriales bacterium]